MSSQSTAAKRKQINSKDDCFWSVIKKSNFLECIRISIVLPFPKSLRILPLAKIYLQILYHRIQLIWWMVMMHVPSFFIWWVKKNFPSSGPKQKIQILRLMKASPSKHNALLGYCIETVRIRNLGNRINNKSLVVNSIGNNKSLGLATNVWL